VLPLRFPWFWSALGWLLVAGVSIGSLLPGNRLPAVFLQDKLLHAGSYCLLMIWFAGLYERKHQMPIAFLLALFGITLDALQALTPTRTFDVRDILANVAGIAVGLLLARLLLGGWCQRVERLLPV
jgi:VanZ family protein